jgi:hypothetical protein
MYVLFGTDKLPQLILYLSLNPVNCQQVFLILLFDESAAAKAPQKIATLLGAIKNVAGSDVAMSNAHFLQK